MSEQIVDLVEAVMPGPRGGVTSELEQLHDDTQKLHDQTQALTASTKQLQDEAVNTLITTDSKSHSSLFSQTSRVFDTVADMTSAPLLFDGMTCRTLGFYEVGDGGGAEYRVISSDIAANGMDVIACHGGLKAQLIKKDFRRTNVKEIGAHGDGTTDDTAVIKYSCNTANTTVFLPSGNYKVTEPINVADGVKLQGQTLYSEFASFRTRLIFEDLPEDSYAITMGAFSEISDIGVEGDFVSAVEDRTKIDPDKDHGGDWLTVTTHSNVSGISGTNVTKLQNVLVSGFVNGCFLRKQGYADSVRVANCVYGFRVEGDFRAHNLQVYSCDTGIFCGGGDTELSYARIDSARVGIEQWFGGVFSDLDFDVIGENAILCGNSTATFSNVYAPRCCANFVRKGDNVYWLDDPKSYAIWCRQPEHVVFSGVSIQIGNSILDEPSDRLSDARCIYVDMVGENAEKFDGIVNASVVTNRFGNVDPITIADDKLKYLIRYETDRQDVKAYAAFNGRVIEASAGKTIAR